MARRRYELIVPLAFIVLGTLIAISLFLEKRYYPMTGVIIITVIFLFFTYLAVRTEKDMPHYKKDVKAKPIISTSFEVEGQKDENYVRLISSKDPVEVEAIKGALMASNIDCIVLDQHSAALMRFIPEVEMRIMVSPKDYEDGLKIIEDLIKEKKIGDAQEKKIGDAHKNIN